MGIFGHRGGSCKDTNNPSLNAHKTIGIENGAKVLLTAARLIANMPMNVLVGKVGTKEKQDDKQKQLSQQAISRTLGPYARQRLFI